MAPCFFTGTIGLRKGPRERISSLANVSVDTLLTGTCSRRLHMPLARAHAMSARSMNGMYYYVHAFIYMHPGMRRGSQPRVPENRRFRRSLERGAKSPGRLQGALKPTVGHRGHFITKKQTISRKLTVSKLTVSKNRTLKIHRTGSVRVRPRSYTHGPLCPRKPHVQTCISPSPMLKSPLSQWGVFGVQPHEQAHRPTNRGKKGNKTTAAGYWGGALI